MAQVTIETVNDILNSFTEEERQIIYKGLRKNARKERLEETRRYIREDLSWNKMNALHWLMTQCGTGKTIEQAREELAKYLKSIWFTTGRERVSKKWRNRS